MHGDIGDEYWEILETILMEIKHGKSHVKWAFFNYVEPALKLYWASEA
jgi:hypothetical protein